MINPINQRRFRQVCGARDCKSLAERKLNLLCERHWEAVPAIQRESYREAMADYTASRKAKELAVAMNKLSTLAASILQGNQLI